MVLGGRQQSTDKSTHAQVRQPCPRSQPHSSNTGPAQAPGLNLFPYLEVGTPPPAWAATRIKEENNEKLFAHGAHSAAVLVTQGNVDSNVGLHVYNHQTGSTSPIPKHKMLQNPSLQHFRLLELGLLHWYIIQILQSLKHFWSHALWLRHTRPVVQHRMMSGGILHSGITRILLLPSSCISANFFQRWFITCIIKKENTGQTLWHSGLNHHLGCLHPMSDPGYPALSIQLPANVPQTQ